MAKLKHSVVISNVEDAEQVGKALDQIKRVCGGGLAAGEATIRLEFDAPTIQAGRARREDDDEGDADAVEAPKPRRTRATADAAAGN